MLRCRRCRKSVLDLTCLSTATDESSSARCTIFHVNVDKLPEWMLTSVHQAQWTVGKLNCHNCGARLGGFNFLNRTECPCGQDATVHLNKSRVDQDHRHYVLSVQPRRTEPGRRHAGLLTDGSRSGGERPQMNRTALDSLQLNCTAVMSHIGPDTRHHAENTQPFSFSPFYCISHRRRCSLEEEGDFRSCFCPVGPVDMSTVDLMRTGSSVSYPDDEALINVAPRRSAVSGGVRSQMHQQLQLAEEDEDSNAETTSVLEEVSDSVLSFTRRSVSDGAAELEEEVLPESHIVLKSGNPDLVKTRILDQGDQGVALNSRNTSKLDYVILNSERWDSQILIAFIQLQASVVFPTSIRLSKREKNRLKSQRRKQRRREKWLHSQLEKEQTERVTGSPLDGEEEGGEGLTCAVCLDIYFSPYSCQPCGHVFCEPCLRTLAKNRPTNTPCPLCRTLISHTSFHEELNQTAKTFFPKVHVTRKQNFQNASCAKWPLPSFRKNFRSFWEYQRNAATAGRGRHAAHRGFTPEALQFNDMCSWLFDIGLVIICVHSFNWILAFLLFSVLLYYFF